VFLESADYREASLHSKVEDATAATAFPRRPIAATNTVFASNNLTLAEWSKTTVHVLSYSHPHKNMSFLNYSYDYSTSNVPQYLCRPELDILQSSLNSSTIFISKSIYMRMNSIVIFNLAQAIASVFVHEYGGNQGLHGRWSKHNYPPLSHCLGWVLFKHGKASR
jgi:hypothetical protein